MKTFLSIVVSIFATSTATSQINYIPVNGSFEIDYSFVNDSCNCFLTGHFDDDNKLDSLFAVMSKSDTTETGIEIYYGDGSMIVLGAGISTTFYEIYDKKIKGFRPIDNLYFFGWRIFEKATIHDDTQSSSLKTIASRVIKTYKIKSDSDFIFIDFGDVFYIICRSQGGWSFINCGV